jgi:hypothetical protein
MSAIKTLEEKQNELQGNVERLKGDYWKERDRTEKLHRRIQALEAGNAQTLGELNKIKDLKGASRLVSAVRSAHDEDLGDLSGHGDTMSHKEMHDIILRERLKAEGWISADERMPKPVEIYDVLDSNGNRVMPRGDTLEDYIWINTLDSSQWSVSTTVYGRDGIIPIAGTYYREKNRWIPSTEDSTKSLRKTTGGEDWSVVDIVEVKGRGIDGIQRAFVATLSKGNWFIIGRDASTLNGLDVSKARQEKSVNISMENTYWRKLNN